jgi:hypothetical protein
MTVFNALDARGDRLADCTRRVRVHGYVGSPIFGGLNRRMNLRFGKLG